MQITHNFIKYYNIIVMKKLIRGKQILIIGIISLVATGVILSSNWSYFIQNNDNNNTALNSYQINTGNSNYIKFNQEEENIMFQINVLKSAISRNNIMYRQYNNVFKSNISYVHLQKSMIRNRIKIANSSIKYEIDVLNNMKSIIHNHPYNYLKFFQSKNYTLPQIVSQNGINSSSSLGNITTNIKNINKSNASVNSIAYQSEEAVIGAKAISSIVSSAKTLIFSKSHFDYSNLYYFSKESNNLSTINKLNNIKKTTKTSNSYAQNRFINNSKYNSYNKSNKSKHRFIFFSNSASIISTVINNPALIAVPVAGAALVSTAVGIGYFVYRHKKMIAGRRDQTNVPEDGVVTHKENTNDKEVADQPVKDNVGATNEEGSDISQENKTNDAVINDETTDANNGKIDKVLDATNSTSSPQAVLVNAEIHRDNSNGSSTKLIVGALDEQPTDTSGIAQPKINEDEITSSIGGTNYNSEIWSPPVNKAVEPLAQRPKIESKNVVNKQGDGEIVPNKPIIRSVVSTESNNTKTNITKVYSSENQSQPFISKPNAEPVANTTTPSDSIGKPQINIMKSSAKEQQYTDSRRNINYYFRRNGLVVRDNATGKDSYRRGKDISDSIIFEGDEATMLGAVVFRDQLVNYAMIKTGEINRDINMDDVAAHISTYIKDNPKRGGLASLSIIKDATDFSRADKTGIALREKTTTHGWFQMPIFEKFDASDLSQSEIDSIREQLGTLRNISSSLPYVNTVKRGYSFGDAKNISEEILGDLNEVTNEFQNHLLKIEKAALKSKATNRTTEKPKAKAEATKDINVLERYKAETKLLKSDVYDVSHLKIHGWNLEEEFQHIANIGKFGG